MPTDPPAAPPADAAASPADARAALAALHRSEERYRAFVEQSGEGIWCFECAPPVPVDLPVARQIEVFYERSVLAECNETMARMYGFSDRQELIGCRLADLLPPSDPANLEYLGAFIASAYRMMDAETREEDRAGRTKHYLNNLVGIIEDGHLVRVWGTQRDITELKDLEARLQHAQKMEAIGMLAGGVAHDFNNILTAIFGYCDLALLRTPAGDGRREELQQIRRAGERAAALTRQLLAFSRRQVMKPKVVDLNEVIGQIESMLRLLVGTRVVLTTRTAADLGAVLADPGQIEQVVMNLAVNARDAMREGGTLTIETSNAVLDEGEAARVGVKPGAYALITVTDTGTGMDEPTLGRIFEPFFTTKAPGQGTGLGLATVYGIVRQSGGHIGVSSAPGRGTVFSVHLPRVEGHVPVQAPAPESPARPPSLTVLLVEDEESLRELARRQIEDGGHRVLAAAGVAEAVALAGRTPGPIDVLVTDVVLRDGTGPEIADRLRGLRPALRTVLMSGHIEHAAADPGALFPDAAFLEKPFTAEALLSALHAAQAAPRAA